VLLAVLKKLILGKFLDNSCPPKEA